MEQPMREAKEQARRCEEEQAESRKKQTEETRAIAARDAANKRAIERQIKAAAELDKKLDGIRRYDPSVRLLKAKQWVEGLQRFFAEELAAIHVYVVRREAIKLGWEKKKGRATCDFCDAHV
jgi:hypothetical protein